MKTFFLAFSWEKAYQYSQRFLKNSLIAQAIAKTPGISGSLLNREEKMTTPNVMRSFDGARSMAVAGVAAVMFALTPAFAQNANAQQPVAYVPPPPAAVATSSAVPASYKPTVLAQAGDYSAKHDVLAVGIRWGAKDDYSLEQVVSAVSQFLDRENIPYRIFAEPGTGDYTNSVFYVRGHAVGTYHLGNILQEGVPKMAQEFRIWTSDGPLPPRTNISSAAPSVVVN